MYCIIISKKYNKINFKHKQKLLKIKKIPHNINKYHTTTPQKKTKQNTSRKLKHKKLFKKN